MLKAKTACIYANRPSNRKLPVDGSLTSNGFANSLGYQFDVVVVHTDLYGNMISPENLLVAYRKARKHKTKKWYVKEFDSGLEEELYRLHEELRTQTYKPLPMKRFVIRDPKSRVIHASHFRDRVVHHAICNVIEPIFEKIFIYDSYASRKDKGTSAAIARFDQFQRKVTQNGRTVKPTSRRFDNNLVIGYVLKADIKKYFQSMDHDVLIGILRRRIGDEKVINLIRIILKENAESTKTDKGVPIGNLTSQFFGNVYLNELDYFVKHVLRTKYYIRYVDDFVILHGDKNFLLDCREKITEFLKSLKIELHGQKSQVYPLHKGISFLGFGMFYYYRLPNKRNIRAFHRRMKEMDELHREGLMSREKIEESMEGWFAYAKWANTYKMRVRLKKDIWTILESGK